MKRRLLERTPATDDLEVVGHVAVILNASTSSGFT
jgi:hypothetical protein